MEQPSQPTSPSAPVTPLGAKTPHAHPALPWVIGGLALAIAVGAAWALINYDVIPDRQPDATGTPAPADGGIVSGKWRAHTDADAGFSFWHPAHLILQPPREFSPDQAPVRFSGYASPKPEEGGFLSVGVYDEPLVSIRTLYEGEKPVSELNKVAVAGRTAYTYSDGDAGCGGTSVFIPLSSTSYAEMGIGDCEGQVTRLIPDLAPMLESFRFSATPGPPPPHDPLGGIPISEWREFSSEHFNLSFRVPPGYVVTDQPNSIRISFGPLQEYAIGSDNAFFSLRRYVYGATKASNMAVFRSTLDYPYDAYVVVDGTEFPVISGTDNGSHEGTSTGSMMGVFFDASELIVTDALGGGAGGNPVSGIMVANHILSTMRFTK